MDPQEWTTDVKVRVVKMGKRLGDLFREARLSPASWSNWKTGKTSPTMTSVSRVEAVLTKWGAGNGPNSHD